MPFQPPTPDSRSHPRARAGSPARHAAALALVTSAYYAAGRLGLHLAAIHPVVTAVWPAAAIATAALAIYGYRLWPGVWAGAILLNLSRIGGLDSVLLIACGNTAAALAGAWFLRRFGGARAFGRPYNLVGFLCASGLLASTLAAGVGTAALYRAGLVEPGMGHHVWFTWWVGDTVTIWILVPFLVLGHAALADLRRRPPIRPIRAAEFLAAGLCLAGTSGMSFGNLLPGPYGEAPTGFLSLPAMFWLSMRFGTLGASSSLMIHSAIAIWGTRHGHGVYAGAPDRYLLLQLYLAVRVFFFQLLAATSTQTRRVIGNLRASERRIQEIIETLPGVVWESWGDPASPDYRVTFVSEQSERLFGFTPGDWLSHPDYLWGRIHPEDRERVRREAAETYAGKGRGTSQYRLFAKDGRVAVVESRMSVMRDFRGRPMGMRGFNLDVTERVETENYLREIEDRSKESQKMEAVDRLAGGVAHDYNNLLTTIIGYSDLILAAAPREGPLAGYAREIREAGNRAADLTRQLLTFSRQDVVQAQVFDLNGLVAEMERRIASLLGGAVRLGIHLEPGPLEVKADPHHVERILFNLVRNSRDAMPKGGVVRVETSNCWEHAGAEGFYLEPLPGPHVVLSVDDTGSGIPPEDMLRLFEPFFTTKGRTRSVGLGLPAVYGIVKRYGGGIRVTSRPGGGTRFEIHLPAHVREPVPARAHLGGASGPLDDAGES